MTTRSLPKVSEIKELRQKYRITKDELAHEAKVAMMTLHRVENGIAPEKRKHATVDRIVEALDRLIAKYSEC